MSVEQRSHRGVVPCITGYELPAPSTRPLPQWAAVQFGTLTLGHTARMLVKVTEEPLVDDDRLFWEIAQRYPTRPMVCGAYLELEGPPERAALEVLLRAAVVAHPRLGQRLVAGARGPVWKTGSDASEPIVTWDDDATLRSHADVLGRSSWWDRLPADGPGWQCRIISDRCDGEADGRVYGLALRWQHALTDGEGMLDLLGALCSAGDDGPRDLHAMNPSLAHDRKPTLPETGGWSPRGAVSRFLQQRRSSGRARATHPGSTTIETHRFALGLDHGHLRTLARAHGVSTHDVVLAWATGAIDRYRAVQGDRDETAILCPVSRRTPGNAVVLGNRSRALRLALGGLPDEPSSRIRGMGQRTASVMASTGAVPYWVFGALFRLPRSVLDRVFAAAPPYICNYLPWSDRPLSIVGQRITAIHGFTPLLPYHGCTIACSSYASTLSCALTVDTTMVAAPSRLVSLLDEGADALRRAA